MSSQSGRILPLETVASFCEEHNIVLVVDGTQSCQLLFSAQKKAVLDRVDFFVMSTPSSIPTSFTSLYILNEGESLS